MTQPATFDNSLVFTPAQQGPPSGQFIFGTGVPSNSLGQNGMFYFRSDGGTLTTIYQRRAGAWIGIV